MKLAYRLKPILNLIGIVIALALFFIPALTIVSLTPKVVPRNPSPSDVLGTSDSPQKELDLSTIQGDHKYISNFTISQSDQNCWEGRVTITKHNSGQYSRPILKISNNSKNDKIFFFSGSFQLDTESKFGIMKDDSNYVIQGLNKDFYRPSVTIPSNSQVDLYLNIESPKDLFFDDFIKLNICEA